MWVLKLIVIISTIYVNAYFSGNVATAISDRSSVPTHINEDNVIRTKKGRVEGFDKDGVMRFFDVPYGNFEARMPFQEAVESATWNETRSITEHKSRCPQMKMDESTTFDGSDECLTLSVFKKYTSEPDNENSPKLADVLFHIHESSFSTGSGDPSIYDPKNLVENDVILVLPNYRLGALGFMCLHNDTAPGNAALKDLTLALQWTANEIEAFGGNPSNIVVSGAGAAGALVEYLLISNASRAYISRAITESGFSLSPWAIDRFPLDTARPLAAEIQSQMDIQNIVEKSAGINFRPCIEHEGGFITQSPWHLLRRNSHSQISYMVGTASHAAWARALRQIQTAESLSPLNEDVSLLLPNDLVFENDAQKLRIAKQVRTLYFGDRDNITMSDVNQLSQLFTDSGYLHPGLRGARLLVRGGAKVYFYEYSFNSRTWIQAFNASKRGDLLDFVFFGSGSNPEVDAEHNNMRKIITSFWVSFIKEGKPSAENIPDWSALSAAAASEEQWLSIGSRVQLRSGLHLNRMRLWQDIYDRHFIENNPAFVHKPSLYILASCLSILGRFGVMTS